MITNPEASGPRTHEVDPGPPRAPREQACREFGDSQVSMNLGSEILLVPVILGHITHISNRKIANKHSLSI